MPHTRPTVPSSVEEPLDLVAIRTSSYRPGALTEFVYVERRNLDRISLTGNAAR